jgi:hypothetical protein
MDGSVWELRLCVRTCATECGRRFGRARPSVPVLITGLLLLAEEDWQYVGLRQSHLPLGIRTMYCCTGIWAASGARVHAHSSSTCKCNSRANQWLVVVSKPKTTKKKHTPACLHTTPSVSRYKHSNSRNNGVGKRHLYPSFYTTHQLSIHLPTLYFCPYP